MACFRLPQILEIAAREIAELFPEERVETYYQPYCNKPKLPARGKLYAKWLNYKRAIVKTKAETSKAKETETFKAKETETISEKQHSSYNKLLNTRHESFEQDFVHWKFSYSVRAMKRKEFVTPLLYFKAFPALSQPLGYQLVNTIYLIIFNF